MSGCIESRDMFTLNPDGSGKVVHVATAPNLDLGFGGDAQAPSDPDMAGRKVVREMLKASKGVDAWRDVGYEMLDDGRVKIILAIATGGALGARVDPAPGNLSAG